MGKVMRLSDKSEKMIEEIKIKMSLVVNDPVLKKAYKELSDSVIIETALENLLDIYKN